jgi:hypothetical protein
MVGHYTGDVLQAERPVTASPPRKKRGLLGMVQSVTDKWSWTDTIRFLIRDCPILALVMVLVINLPEIAGRIEQGYKHNAEELQEIANTQQKTAETYQETSERRDKDLRELNERLITEIKAYHDSMVRYIIENRLKIEDLQDESVRPQRFTPAPTRNE